ncbi:MAG: gyrB [Bacteroidetes bacterium]|nr:gyrB [Bacteroidota bacterium]
MYFGSNDIKGVLNLICGLIKDSIFICQTDNIFFFFEILNEGNFSLKISSENDISAIIPHFSEEESNREIYHLRALKSVTDNFEVLTNNKEIILNFHLDIVVFKETTIDYQNLMDEFVVLALLNRGAEILIKDATRKHVNQNYFSFPEGVFYLYERIKRDTLRKPEFDLLYDNHIKGNKYQIAVTYRLDWHPDPVVVSFANDINTTNGGSLVAGVIDGLILASKKYVKDNKLSTHKIKRRKFFNGLIIVCSVRGKDLEFGGSQRESLATEEVRTQSKEIVSKLVNDYLNNNKIQADRFLSRFDDENFMNKMY